MGRLGGGGGGGVLHTGPTSEQIQHQVQHQVQDPVQDPVWVNKRLKGKVCLLLRSREIPALL